MVDPLAQLPQRLRRQAEAAQALVAASAGWHGELPVLLLDRCWLRLERLAVQDLAQRLPPDGSAEAPELVRYRQQVAAGHPGWRAQQLCWEEFGTEAFQQALQRHWRALEQGNRGWTLERYLQVLRRYRQQLEAPGPRALPLLVLASDPGAEHQIHWLAVPQQAGKPDGPEGPMRHTCR